MATFSSVSSFSSEQSFASGSCAGLFLQIFDWNCRLQKKRRFRRKSLPAERRSPALRDQLCCCNNDNGSTHAVPPETDENNQPSVVSQNLRHASEGNEMIEPLPQNLESRFRDAAVEDNQRTPPEKKKKKRVPNVVAKLMGLETMPSPELRLDRIPLSPRNPNILQNLKGRTLFSDSRASPYRGVPIKLENRWAEDESRQKDNSNNADHLSYNAETKENNPGRPVGDAIHVSTLNDHLKLRSYNKKLCPSDDELPNPQSIISTLKVQTKIVSPVKGKKAEVVSNVPEPVVPPRKTQVKSFTFSSSSASDLNTKKEKLENRKTPSSNSFASKRQSSFSNYSDPVTVKQRSKHNRNAKAHTDAALATSISSKRQCTSSRQYNDQPIQPPPRAGRDSRMKNEKQSASRQKAANSRRGASLLSSSSRNQLTSREEEVAQRLMLGKSAVEGRDYSRSRNAEQSVQSEDKSKLDLKILEQRSQKTAMRAQPIAGRDPSPPKTSRTRSKSPLNTRDVNTTITSGQECSTSSSGVSSISEKDGSFSDNKNNKVARPRARAESSPLMKSLLIKRAAGKTIDVTKQTSVSVQKDDYPSTSEECITEDISGGNYKSVGTSDLLSDGATTGELCIPYNDSPGHSNSSHINDFKQNLSQSVCESSMENIEDTASSNDIQSHSKSQPVSYSGKTTATILQELLTALNLSINKSSVQEDVKPESSESSEMLSTSQSDSSDTSSTLRTTDSDSCAYSDYIRERDCENSGGSTMFVFNQVEGMETKTKHSIKDCNDICWQQSPPFISKRPSRSFGYYHNSPRIQERERYGISDNGFSDSILDNSYVCFYDSRCSADGAVLMGLLQSQYNKEITISDEHYINHVVENSNITPSGVFAARLGLSRPLTDIVLFNTMEAQARHQWTWGIKPKEEISDTTINRLDYERAARANRKLMFDCVNEALNLDMGVYDDCLQTICMPCLPVLSHTHVAKSVCRQINDWKSMDCGMNVDDMVEKAMNTGFGKWCDFTGEVCDIAGQLEGEILDTLIEELVLDLSTDNGNQCLKRNYRLQRKIAMIQPELTFWVGL